MDKNYKENHKGSHKGLVILEAIVILILLFGVAVLFVLLRNKPDPMPSLPTVPTYFAIVPTATPLPPDPPPAAITSTPVATASPVVQTCRNVLYPMVPGQQWLYKETTSNRIDVLDMKVLTVDNSQGNVSVWNQTEGSTKQVQVLCDGDVIRNFPFISVDALYFDDLGYSAMAATYMSGVLAPNEAAFLNSNWALSWSSQYQVSGSTTLKILGRNVKVTMNNSPLTLTCQTLATGDAAFETVTVPAGTFHALKVVCTHMGQAVVYVNGVPFSGQVEGRSNQWFALNTGLVKMQVDYAAVRLYDIATSVLIDNNFELQSFTSAP
jgi:hypothetical protein